MKFIIGKKMAMTQIWNSNDKVVAVTPVQAGPCTVVQVKNKTKDGYEALQLAYGKRKEKNINKPQRGHFKALGLTPAHVREFRTEEAGSYQAGDVISVETFVAGDKIDVTGVSKGKGFQGVVKRHGFHGFRKTHGNKDQERMSGSIGPKGPARVFKGTKMGGRMGTNRVMVKNLEIVSVDVENNIIYVAGALPGAINSLITIKGQGELKVNQAPVKTAEKEEIKEEVKEEIKEKKVETEIKNEEKKEEAQAQATAPVVDAKQE